MDILIRIEHALEVALSRSGDPAGPPRLAEAIRHSVFPGGARIRPRLCLSVALACGADGRALETAAVTGAAIELLHCASLVHDDLPCFDNAATRRGVASVHRAFGEPLAVLAGDALIVLAFESLALGVRRAALLAPLTVLVARAAGTPLGLVAGQAWECETEVVLATYQRAKTASLFACATQAGALAAGADPARWRALGDCLGEAYQVADDINDSVGDAATLGKPCGQDLALGRPSAVAQHGLSGAHDHLDRLIAASVDAIPDCHGAAMLTVLIRRELQRLLLPAIAASRAA
ncbi:polyprenyl synthetase family protein [Lichenicoccus roseus]|uniref:Polyprenyl synthetase family protein n=1 Tax=Lichenicoccus roseus TaxID=2683649 RepID=A0A5R9JAN6_9PROT|nr:polyprenyl synthetase family protein [Lichenicoccus roseus]TLU74059.1 polyprenyl synthetase family protein [Lichenicoccus roseus]